MKRKTLPFLLCMSVATPALAIQPIVGSWLVNDPDGYTVVTFREDGSYILGLDFAGDPTHTGVEWGSYVWDGNPGSTYGLIAATASGDTNGNWGIANDEDGPVKFEVSGNSGIFSSPFATSSTTPLTASRVVHFPGTIIGSWTISNEAPVSANFFADGTYILAESGIADNDGGPGIERGRYSWDSSTGTLLAFDVVTDTSGGWGLWDAVNSTPNVLTVVVSGPDSLLASAFDEPAFTLVAVVPEPHSYAMLLAGLGVTSITIRRRSSTRS